MSEVPPVLPPTLALPTELSDVAHQLVCGRLAITVESHAKGLLEALPALSGPPSPNFALPVMLRTSGATPSPAGSPWWEWRWRGSPGAWEITDQTTIIMGIRIARRHTHPMQIRGSIMHQVAVSFGAL
eukprot:CAMPEP_0180143296 /NCGR_PEP_ID=MMETSP0986-20121125/16178_1 /TAXON_ID=697907 /ORGANISM="non described non described, Strain CCMP2293" /LENGTH=127 /DNA_ID=CAMNT_0022086831 /DNA_START=177 /DNA_END=559 /DNA_ORIENTATION=-